jgi:hypothetical protein
MVYKQTVIEGEVTEVEDYYTANDPDEYVMVLVDHISLIPPERRGDRTYLHEKYINIIRLFVKT